MRLLHDGHSTFCLVYFSVIRGEAIVLLKNDLGNLKQVELNDNATSWVLEIAENGKIDPKQDLQIHESEVDDRELRSF